MEHTANVLNLKRVPRVRIPPSPPKAIFVGPTDRSGILYNKSMITLIKNHNYLNGLIFSFFEYLVVAAILAPSAVYYLAHAQWLYGAITVGVILNCLTVSAFALASMREKGTSVGIWKIYGDADLRRKIQAEYPGISRETLILSVTVLIPFWILCAVLRDLFLKQSF
jgi:hypothetical protein